MWEAVGDWEDVVGQPGPGGTGSAEAELELARSILALQDADTTSDGDSEERDLLSVGYRFEHFGAS